VLIGRFIGDDDATAEALRRATILIKQVTESINKHKAEAEDQSRVCHAMRGMRHIDQQAQGRCAGTAQSICAHAFARVSEFMREACLQMQPAGP
jgi:hypothetical protein